MTKKSKKASYILHINKLLQHLGIRAALFSELFTAWSKGYSLLFRTFLILMHSMKMANCDWTVLYYLGAAKLEVGSYGQMRWSPRWEQSLSPCFTLIKPPLIKGNCCSSWWFHTSREAGVSSPGDGIQARVVNNGGQGVSLQQIQLFTSLMDQKMQQVTRLAPVPSQELP